MNQKMENEFSAIQNRGEMVFESKQANDWQNITVTPWLWLPLGSETLV